MLLTRRCELTLVVKDIVPFFAPDLVAVDKDADPSSRLRSFGELLDELLEPGNLEARAHDDDEVGG